MSVAQGNASSGWSVTGQNEASEVNGAGQLLKGVRIYFRTGGGVDSSVFVPESQYNAAAVRAAIAARAAVVDEIASLAGQQGMRAGGS